MDRRVTNSLFRLSICYLIYTVTMLWSQNELNREIKARLPFQFKNEQVTEVYRLLKESKSAKSSKADQVI